MLLVLQESLILILLVKNLYCCLLLLFFTANMTLKLQTTVVECSIAALLSKSKTLLLLVLYRRALSELLLEEQLHYFQCNPQFWRLLTLIKTKTTLGLNQLFKDLYPRCMFPTHVNVSALPLVQTFIRSFLKNGMKNSCVCK